MNINLEKMHLLAINADAKNKEGERTPLNTFHLVGESNYVPKITFRPFLLVNKLLRSKQGSDNSWKVTAESIYFKTVMEEIFDTTGGMACGRKFGKDTYTMTGEQKEANKKAASWYGFLFGLLDMGDGELKLANFRLTGGKAVALAPKLREMGKNPEDSVMTIELEPNDSNPRFSDLQITVNKSKDIIPTDKKAEIHELINSFVKEHNDRIVARYHEANKNATAKDIFDELEEAANG